MDQDGYYLALCFFCGKLNRLPSRISECKANCGYCKMPLAEEKLNSETKSGKEDVEKPFTPPHKQKTGGKSVYGGIAAVVLVMIVFLLGSSGNTPSAPSPENEPVINAEEPRHSSVLPATHIINRNDTVSSDDPVLEIITDSNDPNHYYFKLLNRKSGESVAYLFVRAGQRIEFNLPPGDYEIRYAMGATWHGWEELFGHRTIYNRFSQSYEIEAGYIHSITLNPDY